MKKTIWLIVAVAIAAIAAVWYFSRQENGSAPPSPPPAGTPPPPAEKAGLIRVNTPRLDEEIRSPIVVEGVARGQWFFEASFPVRLLDGNGREIAVVPAQAQDEWMTTEFVPFRAVLDFPRPSTEEGTLVLEKDNPSGLPEHADELRVPIRFGPPLAATGERAVLLYFYDPERDTDASDNIKCSRAGLAAVVRAMPWTMTPVQDAVRLLLQGGLTPSERARGITTEFPLSGLALESASLRDDTLTLAFADPENRTGGGACRTGILWRQIEATAQQFGAREVRFSPETLFQP